MLRRTEGASTVELALVVPVLLLILAVSVPVVAAGWSYMTVSRAAAAGARYATRVETNARASSVGLTRRPTAPEVEEFVREAAGPVPVAQVTVSPEPARSLPGEAITVTVDYVSGLGTVADLANRVGSLFFGSEELFPSSRTVTISVRGRQE